MIVIAGLLGGLLWGALFAKRKQGQTLDVLQYAAVFAIAGGVLGMFITIAIDRMMAV